MKRAGRFTYGAALALGSLLWSSVAPAQNAEGESARVRNEAAKTTAEILFDEGVQLAETNQLNEACQKFEASEALDIAVGTLLRLADCRERTGKLATAWARFREAESLARAQGMADRARIANIRGAALQQKMGRLTLKVPASPPDGLSITLDGVSVPRASWGSALPIDAGTVTVEASAPGYIPFSRRVSIAAVDAARASLTIPPLERELSAPPPSPRQITVKSEPPAQAANDGYAMRVLGVSLVVAGGAGLVTSGVLAVVAKERDDSSRDYCPEGPRLCTARGVQLRNDAGRLADFATVSAAVGGGLLAAGFVVYLVAPRARAQEHVAVLVTPDARGGMQLRAQGSF